MYRSKDDILKKLAEVRVLHSALNRYRGRVFVHHGRDPKTDTYPVRMALSAFIVQARTIFQYARTQAKADGRLGDYDRMVTSRPIIGFFKDLRDVEIHEARFGLHTQVHATSRLLPAGQNPSFDSSADAAEATIIVSFSQRLVVDDALIAKLEAEGHRDLASAAPAGAPLYQPIIFDGESDAFCLSDRYLDAIEQFVQSGIEAGFIT